MNPSSLNCFVNERKGGKISYQYSCNWPHSVGPKRTVHLLILISIFLPIVVELWLWIEGRLIGFRSQQELWRGNLISSPVCLLGDYFFYFIFLLSSPKNVNMTLSALSTFSAVTDITWPQFMKRHGRDTYRQHNMNILSSRCVLYSALENHIEGCAGNLSGPHLNKTKALRLGANKTGAHEYS